MAAAAGITPAASAHSSVSSLKQLLSVQTLVAPRRLLPLQHPLVPTRKALPMMEPTLGEDGGHTPTVDVGRQQAHPLHFAPPVAPTCRWQVLMRATLQRQMAPSSTPSPSPLGRSSLCALTQPLPHKVPPTAHRHPSHTTHTDGKGTTCAVRIESKILLNREHNVYPIDMFLDKDRLMVFGSSQHTVCGAIKQSREQLHPDQTLVCVPPQRTIQRNRRLVAIVNDDDATSTLPTTYRFSAVTTLLFDISDRTAPRLLRRVDVQGQYGSPHHPSLRASRERE